MPLPAPQAFVPQVAQGGKGMVEEHARTGPAHDTADALAHGGTVAVDEAAAAGGLGGAMRTARQALAGVGQEFAAGGTERRVAFLMAAIEANHLLDDTLLSGLTGGHRGDRFDGG